MAENERGFDTESDVGILILTMEELVDSVDSLTDSIDSITANIPTSTGEEGGESKTKGTEKGLAKLIAQFKLIELILRPIGEIISSVFAPFEILFKLFGAIGRVLSLAFIPSIEKTADTLSESIDPLIDFVENHLTDFVTAIIDLINPITFISEIIQEIQSLIDENPGASFGELFFDALFDVISNRIERFIEVMTPIFQAGAEIFIQTLISLLFNNDFTNAISEASNSVPGSNWREPFGPL